MMRMDMTMAEPWERGDGAREPIFRTILRRIRRAGKIGGEQEHGERTAAENIAGIVSMDCAPEECASPDNVITLYHGTTHDFTEIDVRKGKPFKDFGQGFYATQSRENAVSMALRNRDIELRRLNRRGIARKVTPWLYTFELENSKLESLNVKRFNSTDKEWVRFVVLNRTNEAPQHNYDAVIGATADDVTSRAAQLYMSGEYGDVDSDEAIEFFLRRIQPERLPRQFFFGTQRAANLLVPKGRCAVQ